MTHAAKSLREFQIAFGKYLRGPEIPSESVGVPSRPGQLYRDLLFNNMCGFVDACFPVCKRILAGDLWHTLCREFFGHWRCHTPYFRDIPGEFLQFLTHQKTHASIPPWLLELAHYEWVELSLDTYDEREQQNPEHLSHSGAIYVRGTARNLAYNWPVHKICKDFLPETPQQTFLVVSRSESFEVRFIEVSAATSLLINLLEESPASREIVTEKLSQLLNRECNQIFLEFCNQTIDDLISKEVLIEKFRKSL